jgi:3-methyladenine DNA glycosylase Tag
LTPPVGFLPTIAYAFMRSAELVNDHLLSCFRHTELSGG